MSPRPLALCALLALAAASAPAQTPVLLRLGGPTGRPVSSRIVVTSFMRGVDLGVPVADTTLPTTRGTFQLTQTLDSITGDTLWFTAVIDSAHAESPASPALNAMLATTAATVPGRTTFRVDALGGVISADSSDETGGPNQRRLAGAAGPRDGGFVLPRRAVRVGDTWADSSLSRRQTSASVVSSRRLYRLERIEPRGDSGTAVISMAATVTMQTRQGMTDSPSAGIARVDIAAHRVTAFAITMLASAPSPTGGQLTMRSVTVRYELGDTALTPPRLDVAAPAAMPAAPPPRPPN